MANKMIRTALATGILALWGLSFLRAQSAGGFRFRGVLSRLVVPKNAGLNQKAIFCLDNPSLSGVEIRIYSLNGALVSSAETGDGTGFSAAGNGCPQDSLNPAGGPRYATWDGTSNGSIVHGGVYVYEVKAEGLTYTGTLVVVR